MQPRDSTKAKQLFREEKKLRKKVLQEQRPAIDKIVLLMKESFRLAKAAKPKKARTEDDPKQPKLSFAKKNETQQQ